MSDQESRTQIELAIDNLMRRDLITRRTFMRRAGRGGLAFGAALTLPSLLAACAPGSSQSANLKWLNWPAYIDIDEEDVWEEIREIIAPFDGDCSVCGEADEHELPFQFLYPRN